VTPDERWLAALWPFVRAALPAAPAEVIEIGCGPLGGFVPMLRSSGYGATGVDPEAPQAPGYAQVEFERYEMPQPAAAIVACTSLHHVADLRGVLDLAAAALAPGGVLVIVEWAMERFDEATARWCSGRLSSAEADEGWLHRRLAEWRDAGQPWDSYRRSWAQGEGLHTGQDILRELQARFDRELLAYGPYFFADLAGTSEADEQAAIDAGEIQANRITYIGRRRAPASAQRPRPAP
jgi:SAM-dependent methyltransferase